ncbi:MAG: nicotinate-nucleotide adenylyltransferase [Acidobacteriota bacterium]|nr:nicotinate-nucleotide adenylyltransferase [Acidobacteriota bacterium]
MDRKKRIALYGGTFDPVHLGHLEVARKVSRLFELDELWFVVAQIAPHKAALAVTSAWHRYAMLVLATRDDPKLFISTFELDAPDRSYTVDTLAHFKSALNESADLYFVMGADSWCEINSWRDCDRLLGMANHIVVSRPGYSLGADHLTSELRPRIVDLRLGDQTKAGPISQGISGERIFITDAVMTDVSATDIRRGVRENTGELAAMVPPAVADYIRKYRLYRDTNER